MRAEQELANSEKIAALEIYFQLALADLLVIRDSLDTMRSERDEKSELYDKYCFKILHEGKENNLHLMFNFISTFFTG